MTEKVKLPDDKSVETGLAKVHASDTPNDSWIVIGYSDANTLTVVAEGGDGLSGLLAHFPDDQPRHAILRKTHKVELAETVKFVWIDWTPVGIKPMRKALVGTHKGQIKTILAPFHVAFQPNDKKDISDELILEKIGMASGTKSNVTEQKAWSAKDRVTHVGTAGPVNAFSTSVHAEIVNPNIRAERTMAIDNEQAVRDAIKAVRKNDSEVDWVLVNYAEAEKLQLLAHGGGGVEGLRNALNDREVLYGFFRVKEMFDKTLTTKFVFMKVMSAAITGLRKAKLSTHRGFVTKIFEPYHIEIELDSPAELTAEMVTEKIQDTMGTKSRVTQKEATVRVDRHDKAREELKRGPAAAKESGLTIAMEDEVGFKHAISDVRSDSNASTWMMSKYVDKKMFLTGSGSGDVTELVPLLKDDEISFGLLRVTDKIDNSTTVKFVFISWTGSQVKPQTKALVSANKGSIEALFEPQHVKFFSSDTREFTVDNINERVQAASGSKSRVH